MGTSRRSRPPKGKEDIDNGILQLNIDDAAGRNKKSPDFIVIKRSHRHQFMSDYVRSRDTDKFHLLFNVRHYKREEIKVRKLDKFIEVTCEHAEKEDKDGSIVSRRYVRRCPVPNGVKLEAMKTGLSRKGILKVQAPMETQEVPADPNVVANKIRERSNAPPRHTQSLSLSDLMVPESDDEKIVTICFRWNPRDSFKADQNFVCITDDFTELRDIVNGGTAPKISSQLTPSPQQVEDPALNNNTIPLPNMNLLAENMGQGSQEVIPENASDAADRAEKSETEDPDADAVTPPDPE